MAVLYFSINRRVLQIMVMVTISSRSADVPFVWRLSIWHMLTAATYLRASNVASSGRWILVHEPRGIQEPEDHGRLRIRGHL